MDTAFVRKPSGIESFFIDLDECGCNMTFHFFLQLNTKPSLSDLNSALLRVLNTHPGINMKLEHNVWLKSDYIPKCSVVEIDGNDISSYKPNRLDFHKHTFSLSVLHMIERDLWYLCFDFFHGVADGRSGIQFIYDFFDILNGNAPCENEFLVSDREIVRDDGKADWKDHHPAFTVLPKCSPIDWNPCKNGENKSFIIKNDVCIRSVAAKLSEIIGQHFGKKSAKMIIPVDVRRYASENNKALFGNLFVPIFLDVKCLKNLDELRRDIVSCVKKKPRLKVIADNLGIYCKFHPKLRRSVIRFFLPIVMSSKRFIYCALVSPLGNIDSSRLQAENIKVNDVAVTIASFPFTAFTVISLQFNGHTNTTVSWHSGRVSHNSATKLIENIKAYIGSSAPETA